MKIWHVAVNLFSDMPMVYTVGTVLNFGGSGHGAVNFWSPANFRTELETMELTCRG